MLYQTLYHYVYRLFVIHIIQISLNSLILFSVFDLLYDLRSLFILRFRNSLHFYYLYQSCIYHSIIHNLLSYVFIIHSFYNMLIISSYQYVSILISLLLSLYRFYTLQDDHIFISMKYVYLDHRLNIFVKSLMFITIRQPRHIWVLLFLYFVGFDMNQRL